MRLARVFLVLAVIPALALAAACGSNRSSPASDAGTTPLDGSTAQDTGAGAAVDASGGDAPATLDGGIETETGPVVGACPAVSVPGAEATHGNPPNVSSLGGPVLHSPRIVTFTFADTPNASALQAFGAGVASSAWFAQTLADYTTTSLAPPGLSVALAANGDPTYVDYGGVGLGADAGAGGGTDLNAFINAAIGGAVAAST
ncbi:MAG: hypothetical protein ACRELB_15505, partial [Polyangiaceae bacterium]